MRLSAYRDDIGFKALKISQRYGARAVVTVDGAEVRHCVTADTKRGIAVVYDVDRLGRAQLYSRHDAVRLKIIPGRVAISFVRD